MATSASSVFSRAVHLKIVPRLQTYAESQTILRMLQGFGEVQYYKNLNYERLRAPNTALAIFRDETAAQALIKESPLRFTMIFDESGISYEQENVEPSNEAVEQKLGKTNAPESEAELPQYTSPSSAPVQRGAWGVPIQTRSLSTFNRQQLPKPKSQHPEEREYEIQVNRSTMNHRDHINVSHYHGPFAIDSKSAIQEDLAKRVPLPGLSDLNFRRPDKPWRILSWQRAREEKTRTPLRKMYEQGLRNKAGTDAISAGTEVD